MILQQEFLVIHEWCKENFMELNLCKCKCITYTRKSNSNKIVFNYGINETFITRCSIMNDLGIMIDERVTMNDHVDYVTGKARRSLGFVKRHAKDFNDPYVTKALYCAIVRPTLEYCIVSWMPFTQVQINKLESIQRQFLLFALRNLGWNDGYQLPKYEDRLKLLQLDTLNDRRILINASFMYKLLNGKIDAIYLKDQLNLNESRYATRNRPTFVHNQHSTSYGMNEPITRLTKLYNMFSCEFVESNSVDILKTKIKQKL